MKVKRPWTDVEVALATLAIFMVIGATSIAADYLTRR